MRKTLVSIAIGMAFTTPVSSFAQETEEVKDTGPKLEKIIITGQRREERLEDAAIAVSAKTGEDIVNAGITQTSDLSRIFPALQINSTGAGGASIFIRGVGTLQGDAFGENPNAFNFDGVYIARPTAPVGSMYDLKRVEVLKGPQGTLYGRNATGGAINVLPERPTLDDEISGNFMVDLGNYEKKQFQGAINIPLTDTMAFRLAGQVIDREGYNSDGTSDEKGEALRASLLIQPNDALSIALVADYYHQGGKGSGSVLMPGGSIDEALNGAVPALEDRIAGSDPISIAVLEDYTHTLPGEGTPPESHTPYHFMDIGYVVPPQDDSYNDSTFWGLTANIDWQTDNGTWSLVPAYRRSEPDFVNYTPGFKTDLSEVDDQYSLELRYASENEGPFNYVAGAFYFNEEQSANNYFYQGDISGTYFTPELATESQAVFAQSTYDVSESFRVVTGIRYTDETREQNTDLVSLNPGYYQGELQGESPTDAQLNAVLARDGHSFPGKLDFDAVTWKAGIEWDVSDENLFYTNVSTGFKAGGFYVAAPDSKLGNTFDPEELTAYTIGSKNTLLDGSLQINAEIFYWDYVDQQISYVGGVISADANGDPIANTGKVTVNAGQATIKGFEIELDYAFTAQDTLSFDVQYLKAQYDQLKFDAFSASPAPPRIGCDIDTANAYQADGSPAIPGPNGFPEDSFYPVDCSGNVAINSPEWTINFSYEHVFEFESYELYTGGNAHYETSRATDISYVEELVQDSNTMLDAFFRLESIESDWTLTAYINNITNEQVLAGPGIRPVLSVGYGVLKSPRTYGLRLNYNF